jgi:apolipoprotein N-acyltransferase|tara:strand:+ start:11433 stop:13481 length:2049 start_codon:yes stop_codon:yes gene_type:complete
MGFGDYLNSKSIRYNTSTMRERLVWLLLTTLSGILLKLAVPPLSLGYFAFFALCPLLYIVRHFGLLTSITAGFIVGLFWFSEFPQALLSWDKTLVFGSLILGSAYFSMSVGLCWIAFRFFPRSWIIFAFPCCWVISVVMGHEIFGIPLAISPLLSFSAPSLLSIVGFYGNEFVITFVNSCIFWLLLSRSKLAAALLFSLCVLSVYLFLIVDKLDEKTRVVAIKGIQPSISQSELAKSAWSLYERNKQKESLINMTNYALSSKTEGLVLWPEGAIKTPIFGLKENSQQLGFMTEKSRLDLIATGHEFNSEGKKMNTATLFSNGKLVDIGAKTLLAPIVESELVSGQVHVFQTVVGKVGLVICFEALFESHYRRLIQQDVDFIVVLTDDSSLGNTYLAHTHAAYVIAFGMAHKIPIVFLNNNGISFALNPLNLDLVIDNLGNTPRIYEWDIYISDTNRISFFYWLTPLFSFVIFIVFLLKNRFSLVKANNQRTHTYFFLTLSIVFFSVLAICINFSMLMLTKGYSINSYFLSTIEKVIGEPSDIFPDTLSPLFKQQSQNTCGAAVLAFVITKMGGLVFEDGIYNEFPPAQAHGYSMFELVKILQTYGFVALGGLAKWSDLPIKGDQPVIVHVGDSHFLVILFTENGKVVFFDPAYGRVIHITKSEFENIWKGSIISIQYDAYFT